MPVMQRLDTGIAAEPEVTCTAILSMLVTCAAVMAVPGFAVSQQVAEKLVKAMAPVVRGAQYWVESLSPLR